MPELSEKRRPVAQLGHDGAEVLDLDRTAQGTWWNRVDRHEPRLDVLVVLPGAQQPVGLHGLAAEDTGGRGDQRDAQRPGSMRRLHEVVIRHCMDL